MYKLLVFAALLAAASAAPGYLGAPLLDAAHVAPWGSPYASPWGHGLVGAPVLGAPVVKAAVPVATSYANTVRVATPAVVAHSPYAVAAHSPYAVAAHAPYAVASPYAHAW